MRFLRLSLSSDLVQMGDSVKRIDVLNNSYLTDGTVVELSRIETKSDIEALFEANPSTLSYELFNVEGNQHYVYHHLQPSKNEFPHQLISLLDEYRLIIIYPIRFDAETGASVTLIGTTEMVQEAYGRLPREIQKHITFEQVSETLPSVGGARSLLTERQREVLDTAVKIGYYSVPRQATSTDVAEALDCAPSTASEHLRKIEARILSELSNQ